MADVQTPMKTTTTLESVTSSSSKEAAPISKSQTKKDIVERLAAIVRGVTAPFACGGSEDIGNKEVVIQRIASGTKVTVRPPAKPAKPPNASWNWSWQGTACQMQVEMLKPLTETMPQAAFGQGNKTKIDTSVRDALQLQAQDFDVDIPQDVMDKILSTVRAGLSIETDIVAERYSLNVYRENGKFLKHKDTPRGSDMLGTLVICVPSFYTGGAMRVSQGMKEHTFFEGACLSNYSWGAQSQDMPLASQLKWCAFFADVDHEIQTVTGGLRITLAYLLRRRDCKPAAECIPQPLTQPQQYVCLTKALLEAMQVEKFLKKGGRLGFPCFHLYTNSEVFPGDASAHTCLDQNQLAKLKGRDAVIARAAAAAGLRISLVPFLGHDYSAEEGGEYKLARFPEKKRVPRRMSNDTIESHFKTESMVESYEDEALWVFDVSSGAKRQAGETEWNSEGYFGNEASDISFYVHAALYVQIPSFQLRQELVVKDLQIKPEDLGVVSDASMVDAVEQKDSESGSCDDGGISEEFGSGESCFEDEFGFYDSDDAYGDEFDEDSDDFGMPNIPPAMMELLSRAFASQRSAQSFVSVRPKAKAPARAKPKAKAPAAAKAKAKGRPKAAVKAKAKAKGKAKSISVDDGPSKRQKR